MSGQEPSERIPARLPLDGPPRLVVVVDTEEEFDWGAPFDPLATTVEAMSHQHIAQRVCEKRRVVPTYVIDYPVATQERGFGPISEWVASGTADIGAHLHPWVNPPIEEEVSVRNSFPGNLPEALEGEKLQRLTGAIEEASGARPRVYKAGRYGFGTHTANLLETQGYEVDLSANPPFDYRSEEGPDFSGFDADPYWFGSSRKMLGIPGTSGYVGWLGAASHSLYRLATAPALSWSRLPGVLSRIRAVDRLRVSPEGYTTDEMKRLTRHLFDRGTRVFTFSYHSPSLLPGCTPYVRSQSDLADFVAKFEGYFDFFFGELGGLPTTPLELKAELEKQAATLSS